MRPDQRRADQTSVERWDQTSVEQTRPASRDGIRPASSRPESQTTCSSRRRTRLLARADGAQLFVLLSCLSSFSGTVHLCVACSHWADRVSRLRLLAKDHPGSDPLVVHWPQNDAFSPLVPGQNEMLRERTNSSDNSSSSVVVGVVISV